MHTQSYQMAAFAQERAAFEDMLPQLLQEQQGKIVVVYQGKVVAVGDEVGPTLEQVYARFGYVPCYAGRVEASPRIYQFPHRNAVNREMQAYIALHPQLKEQYLGQYVAIYGGKLVDRDDNYDQLFDRVDTAYPNEFVWLTQVDNEPLKTLVFRSPRLGPPVR